MTFISYAQNYEDVMLRRAFQGVEHGFYMDVGANNPHGDSVTRAFYEQGWCGINIEPTDHWFQELQRARPNDINLQVAAGDQDGEIVLYEIPYTGLSTTDPAIARRHREESGHSIVERKVPVLTLNTICKTYHEAPIHFLNIDVEGAEKAVLQGLDLQRFRPWIIIVESTLPNTTVQSYEEWEPMLTQADYVFTYFDGLNRFYLAREHEELALAFELPPHIFDDFIRLAQWEAERRAQEAEVDAAAARAKGQAAMMRIEELETERNEQEARVREAQSDAREGRQTREMLDEKNAELEQKLEELEQAQDFIHQLVSQLKAMESSWSWRVTWPLRKAKSLVPQSVRFLKDFLGKARQWAVALLKRAFNRLVRLFLDRPSIRERVERILLPFPSLRDRLAGAARNAGQTQSTFVHPEGPQEDSMSENAQRIYLEIQDMAQKAREKR